MTKTMTSDTDPSSNEDYTLVYTEDLFDIVCLCHAAMQKDAPSMPIDYLNQILNIATGPLPRSYRDKIDGYIYDKKYLPPVEIVTNEVQVVTKPNLIL